MTEGNVQLQKRGGKNYQGFLGMINAFSSSFFKVKSLDIVVLEGTNDLSVGEFAGFASLYGSIEFLTIYNRNGVGPIDAALYFRDKYGSEVQLDSVTGIANGASDFLSPYFDFFTLLLLSKGDQFILRISGDISSGEGVHVARSVCQMGSSLFLREGINEKILQSSLEYQGPPGAAATIALLSVINTSATAVDWESVSIDSQGFAIQGIGSPGQIPAGGAGVIALPCVPGITGKVEFTSGLPSEGYLYGSIVEIMPMNAYDAEPVIE